MNWAPMLIPPFFIDCVAALGNLRPIPRPGGHPPQIEWVTTGTGFFYGSPINPDDAIEKRQYRVFLVTAKHVLQSHIDKNEDIRVRLNSEDINEPAQAFELSRTIGPGSWFVHPDQDVAVTPINWDFLTQHGIEPGFFQSDRTVANRAMLRDREVAAGDGIFVLGFPMGLTGNMQRNYVIVRQGCIARISDLLDDRTLDFLIDASVYPGNSGGPVILRPEAIAIEGTKNQLNATLIGLVQAYLTYEETAVSLQTNRPRVIFQENSGLARVLPVDFIDDTIAACLKAFPAAPQAKPEILPPAAQD